MGCPFCCGDLLPATQTRNKNSQFIVLNYNRHKISEEAS